MFTMRQASVKMAVLFHKQAKVLFILIIDVYLIGKQLPESEIELDVALSRGLTIFSGRQSLKAFKGKGAFFSPFF